MIDIETISKYISSTSQKIVSLKYLPLEDDEFTRTRKPGTPCGGITPVIWNSCSSGVCEMSLSAISEEAVVS